MLLIIPPSIDVDNCIITQIKHEVYFESNMSSTCLNNAYYIVPEDFLFSNWKKENIYSTNLSLAGLESPNTSTWEERDFSEFDLVATVDFSNTIKLKSKIKTVTKYRPYIVID